ncbi:MAG: hypothetical protein R2854_14095 [Caldilineaceae bacterium]
MAVCASWPQVHHAVVDRLEGHIHCFNDGQRVHVGADADGRPVAGADLGDHARPSHLGADVGVADLGQRIGHQLGRAHLLKTQLGVLVNIAAQPDDLILERHGLG